MDEPIASINPPADSRANPQSSPIPARPMAIDYFNAQSQEPHPSRWKSGHFRSAFAAGFIVLFFLVSFPMGYRGPLMILPLWICGIWYTVERTLATRAESPFCEAMAILAAVAVALSPFIVLGDFVRFLWLFGWHTPFVSDLQRVVLVVFSLTILAFTFFEISDLLRRRGARPWN